MSKDYKKLYEDVVALAKDGLTDGLYLSRSAKDVTEFLFPQLKKSENERISKKLIQLLQNGGRLPDEEHKQALSWLEKQGKIKLTHYDSAEKEKSDFVSGQFIQCRRSFNEFKEDESYLLEYIGDDTYIGKSDNVLDEEFYITPRQLFTLFTHEHCPRTDSECEKKDEDNMKDKIIESLQRYMPTDELSEEQEMIAWLEKRGEQKHPDMIEPKFKPGDKIVEKDMYEGDSGTIKEIRDGKYIFEDNCFIYIQEQDLWQLVDEYKPKFKVGDWITNGEYTWKVTSIYPLDYILQSPNGNTVDDTISHVDEHFHLWTIQDAKDGDVLNSYRVKATIIFKGWNSDGKHINAYCALQQGILIKQEMLWDRDFEPATKERHDLLFQKMKEEGYEWNADNKELKKIEQESTWNEENEGIRKELTEFLKKASGGFLDTTTHCKTFGKWLAWLEKQGGKVDVLDDFPTEFERQISHLIASSINNEWEYKKDFVKHTANALLQYAKNELEKQGEKSWSEEDKNMLLSIINDAEQDALLDKEQINWLKSLKDRVQPQPKQEWGEEDEKMFDKLYEIFYRYGYSSHPEIDLSSNEAINLIHWLKSLKSNHWKPSEEQIGALNYAYCELFKRGENGEGSNCVHPLMTLIDDLKKL